MLITITPEETKLAYKQCRRKFIVDEDFSSIRGSCPIARAIKKKLGTKRVEVDNGEIRINGWFSDVLTNGMKQFINVFDRWVAETGPMPEDLNWEFTFNVRSDLMQVNNLLPYSSIG